MATTSGVPNYSKLFINLFDGFVNMSNFAISFKLHALRNLLFDYRGSLLAIYREIQRWNL